MSRFETAAQTINSADFGTPFIVHLDGSLTKTDSIVPDSLDFYGDRDSLEGAYGGWTAVTGLTGQHGYNGPIMHESEYFSASCLEAIMQDVDGPVHVALTPVVDVEHPDTLAYGELFGWAILTLED